MRASIKRTIINFIPPFLTSFLTNLLNNKWRGNYHTWAEAELKTTGYNDKEILNKVHESLYEVKLGKSKYERDSVLFDEIQYSWPLLSGIMMASAKSNGKIHVLDFGGSLGSTYYQNKKFLDCFEDVIWCIVEQQNFVKIGKEDFEDERLKFYSSVENCLKEQSINILLLSSVIEYIEKPYELLKKLLPQLKVDYILIDRTPFINGEDKIVIQTVPSSIYKASYPCHLFNLDKFKTFFTSNGYTLFEEFEAIDGNRKEISFKGMIYFLENKYK
jgi:putative methyltransferase (TIGR04325 family)